MTTVLLIRHGRTAANATGTLAGRTPGVSLDTTGRRQARALATRLRPIPIDLAVTSPLERCRQTAALALANRNVPVHTEARLIEQDFGTWTGRPLAELARSPLWSTIQESPSQALFPGGEATAAMAARATDALAHWCAQVPDGVIALVSHADVIKAILSDALGQPLDAFQRIVVAPASISVIRRDAGRVEVLGLNDTGGSLPGAHRQAEPPSAEPGSAGSSAAEPSGAGSGDSR